jgi:hypothetical protein
MRVDNYQDEPLWMRVVVRTWICWLRLSNLRRKSEEHWSNLGPPADSCRGDSELFTHRRHRVPFG